MRVNVREGHRRCASLKLTSEADRLANPCGNRLSAGFGRRRLGAARCATAASFLCAADEAQVNCYGGGAGRNISADMIARIAAQKPDRMATFDLFQYIRHLANGQSAQPL